MGALEFQPIVPKTLPRHQVTVGTRDLAHVKEKKGGRWVSGKKSKEEKQRKGMEGGERWVSGKKSKEEKERKGKERGERWVSGKKSKEENWFGASFSSVGTACNIAGRERERERLEGNQGF